jgi:hypothetical protein
MFDGLWTRLLGISLASFSSGTLIDALIYPFGTKFLCFRTGGAYFPTVIDTVPPAFRDGPLCRVCRALYSAPCSHTASDTLLVVLVARDLQAQVFGGSSEHWVYELVLEFHPCV